MNRFAEFFRKKENHTTRPVTLEALGLGNEPDKRLNLIHAPIAMRTFSQEEDDLFIGIMDKPLASEYLATLLNGIQLTYPEGVQKSQMNTRAIVADHTLPHDAHQERIYESLHKAHWNDPVIGPYYQEFTIHHVDQWLKAEQAEYNAMENAFRLMDSVVHAETISQNVEKGYSKTMLAEHFTTIGTTRLWHNKFYVRSIDAHTILVADAPGSFRFYIDTQDKPLLFFKYPYGSWRNMYQIYPPIEWKITKEVLPRSYTSNAMQPLLAWKKQSNGSRIFLSQQEAMTYVSGDPILNKFKNPDVLLGRCVIGYHSADITQSFKGHKMKLRKQAGAQYMAAAQMPVWLSLPQHAPRLLADINPLITTLEANAVPTES